MLVAGRWGQRDRVIAQGVQLETRHAVATEI